MHYRAPTFRLLYLVFAALAASHQALATETDQFTTSPRPLYDIGPELSRKVVEIIESDRSGNDPERVLHKYVGHNVIESRLSGWVKGIRGDGNPVEFRPSVVRSIYRWTFSPVPGSFTLLSPTVSIHGNRMGTDKIDHFFQQGYEYFKLMAKRQANGEDETKAIAAAVARGVKQEHSYFGTLSSGVYSNGDLAANYAGMKFYLNLQRSVRIGERVLPPMFERTSNGWKLRPGVDPDRLLEPFLSNHLDESLNPSRYRFSRGSIRTMIRNRCAQWTRFYADRLTLVAPAGRSFASSWFGENYGYWLPADEEISIATECDASQLFSLARNR